MILEQTLQPYTGPPQKYHETLGYAYNHDASTPRPSLHPIIFPLGDFYMLNKVHPSVSLYPK